MIQHGLPRHDILPDTEETVVELLGDTCQFEEAARIARHSGEPWRGVSRELVKQTIRHHYGDTHAANLSSAGAMAYDVITDIAQVLGDTVPSLLEIPVGYDSAGLDIKISIDSKIFYENVEDLHINLEQEMPRLYGVVDHISRPFTETDSERLRVLDGAALMRAYHLARYVDVA